MFGDIPATFTKSSCPHLTRHGDKAAEVGARHKGSWQRVLKSPMMLRGRALQRITGQKESPGPLRPPIAPRRGVGVSHRNISARALQVACRDGVTHFCPMLLSSETRAGRNVPLPLPATFMVGTAGGPPIWGLIQKGEEWLGHVRRSICLQRKHRGRTFTLCGAQRRGDRLAGQVEAAPGKWVAFPSRPLLGR